jgi:hypothetical protein
LPGDTAAAHTKTLWHLPEPGNKRRAECGDALPLASRLPSLRSIVTARFFGAGSMVSRAEGRDLDAYGDRVA